MCKSFLPIPPIMSRNAHTYTKQYYGYTNSVKVKHGKCKCGWKRKITVHSQSNKQNKQNETKK